MRLKTMKLSGFKSFVDPTSINFPSNLCGVVGPNGCGKSNIIDAVRWVMGESSAKQLRGDSITDVIFNGSSGRKPVGQAVIELVFDNSDGRIVGEYAAFNEISVKRRVSREGSSDYFLNGSRCRRRDIMDVFLGTGLGPRSYSIIEQGMISNLITAKAEDLRVYIEEAAGISKYKERRKDTENRIRRTRENLERLTDIRDELQRQLARLQRQAKAAEKYREYKGQQRILQKQVLALQWQAFDQQANKRRQALQTEERLLEEIVARELGCDREIETLRANHIEVQDQFNAVQSRYYGQGAEISRLQQQIQHIEDTARKLREDLSRTEQSVAELNGHIEQDQQKATGWDAELAELKLRAEQLSAASQSQQDAQASAEQAMQAWQQRWDEFAQKSAESNKAADVKRLEIRHLDDLSKNALDRADRLKKQLPTDAVIEAHRDTIAQLTERQATASAALEKAGELDAEFKQQAESLLSEERALADQQSSVRGELQSVKGRLSSLKALYERESGADDKELDAWLNAQGLAANAKLIDQLAVAAEWQSAVEAALGNMLFGVAVSDIDSLGQAIDDFKMGALNVLQEGNDLQQEPAPTSLANYVDHPAAKQLLLRVHGARDLAAALELRTELPDGDCAITPDGIWVGRNWLRKHPQSTDDSSVIQRRDEIAELEQTLARFEAQETELSETLSSVRGRRQGVATQAKQVAADVKSHSQAVNQLGQKLSSEQARLDQKLAGVSQQQQEIESCINQAQANEQKIAQARNELTLALDAMEANNRHKSELQNDRLALSEAQTQARRQAEQGRSELQQIKSRRESVQAQLASLRGNILRMRSQLERLQTHHSELVEVSSDQSQPAKKEKAELEALLASRLDTEKNLTDARQRLQEIELKLQSAEKRRQTLQGEANAQREVIQNQRLQVQEAVTRADALLEQLAGDAVEKILAELSDDATIQDWQAQLDQVGQRIDRLGPINLAAIDEYQSESERKAYLDIQDKELSEALSTLENAIRKIDRETRSRFKETFDAVNTHFKTLFPQLFGGGHAYLDLTSDDLLETGVTIMARPPGKRNTTIHLLSGGEKALTAIALVFAIFKLNPAPFCMLDEVDAPLDDANVGRFADMVSRMADEVQFIYISHNKIAMEMAHQLMGVTMGEPGVSRLVTVDVDQAVELVAG